MMHEKSSVIDENSVLEGYEDLKCQGGNPSADSAGDEGCVFITSSCHDKMMMTKELSQQSPCHGAKQPDDNAFFGFSRSHYMEGVRAWSMKLVFPSPPMNNSTVMDENSPPSIVPSPNDSLSIASEDDAMNGCDDAETEAEAVEDGPESSSKGVTFNEKVRILPIPPISSYSLEQRFKLYANRYELRQIKIRNKKEYAFDGYDWRNATEEGNMAICPLSGELLHPAHL